MILAPHRDVFLEADSLEYVLSLLRLVAEQRVSWVLTASVGDAALAYLAAHAPNAPQARSLLVKKAIAASAYGKSDTIPLPGAQLESVVGDLQRPIVLVLEDQVSDGTVVMALMEAHSPILARAFRLSWIEIRHAGGAGRIADVAKAALAQFKCLYNVMALYDSDRLAPAHISPHQADALDLEGVGIVTHVLLGREIENYIPNRALAAITTITPRTLAKRIGALKLMTLEQRAYFDFKKGFAGKQLGGLPTEQQDLYSGAPSTVFVDLADGFGSKMYRSVSDCGGLDASDFSSLGTALEGDISALLAKLEGLL